MPALEMSYNIGKRGVVPMQSENHMAPPLYELAEIEYRHR